MLAPMEGGSVTTTTPKKERHVSVWVTPAQKAFIARAAAAEGEKPSRWLRTIGLKRARELLPETAR